MTGTSASMLPVPSSRSATPTPRTGRLRRPLGVAVLVAAGALLAGCGSDDGDSTGAGDTTVASDTTMAMDTTGATAEAGDLTITTARIGEPAGPTAGLFLSVENAGDQPDTLVAVATDVSPEVQLHETVTDGDTTSMNQLSGDRDPGRRVDRPRARRVARHADGGGRTGRRSARTGDVDLRDRG
ncbi:MAG: copper chaperone PCu(A)C [Microthrixaceae bacterium]